MKKSLLSKSVAATVLLASAGSAMAALSFNGVTVTENFDGLPTAAAAGAVATSPFSATVGTQAIATGTSFVGTKVSGTGTTAIPLVVDNGGLNSGGIYSYGTTTTSADRALGLLASGSNVGAIGVEITNDSGLALSSVTISLTGEVYRTSTSTVNTLVASYEVGAAGLTNFLVDTTATAIPTLNVVGPTAVVTNAALDGNLLPIPLTATIPFTTPIAAGQSFYLRFVDTNDVGNDAGLAIDNFSFSALTVPIDTPEPASLGLLAVCGVLSLRRRSV